jgi:hypothetical protein
LAALTPIGACVFLPVVAHLAGLFHQSSMLSETPGWLTRHNMELLLGFWPVFIPQPALVDYAPYLVHTTLDVSEIVDWRVWCFGHVFEVDLFESFGHV